MEIGSVISFLKNYLIQAKHTDNLLLVVISPWIHMVGLHFQYVYMTKSIEVHCPLNFTVLAAVMPIWRKTLSNQSITFLNWKSFFNFIKKLYIGFFCCWIIWKSTGQSMLRLHKIIQNYCDDFPYFWLNETNQINFLILKKINNCCKVQLLLCLVFFFIFIYLLSCFGPKLFFHIWNTAWLINGRL